MIMKRLTTLLSCGLLMWSVSALAEGDEMAREMCELALNTHLFEDDGAGAEGATVASHEDCRTQQRSREYWVCVLDNMWAGRHLGPAEQGCQARKARSE